MRGEQPHGPYVLAGWSMGGLVAHAMAHLLAAAGEPVRVIVIDMAARPQLGDDDEASLRARFDADILGIFGDVPLDPAELARLFAVFRAHVTATRAYEPPVATWPVMLVKGADGVLAGAADPTWGWSEIAPTLSVTTLPGTHYSLLTPPNVAQLAALIALEIGL